MRIISKIQNVSNYFCFYDKLYLIKNDSLVLDNIEIYKIKSSGDIKNLGNKILVISHNDGECFLFENDSFIGKVDPRVSYPTGDFLAIYNYDNPEFRSMYNILDLNSDKLIFDSYKTHPIYCFLNTFYSGIDKSIFAFDLSGNQIWEHNLSYLGLLEGRTDGKKDVFQKFIGVAHNNLWIISQSGKVAVINVKTGDLTKVFEWTDEYVDKERYRPKPTEAFIYEGNYIYSLGRYFIKINTKTLEVEEKRMLLDAAHDGEKIEIRTSSFQGQHISFIASTHGTSWVKIIGLFSIKEEKIIWTHQLFDNKDNKFIPAFNTPQLAGNRLYILDNEKTLHIFENGQEV